MSGPSLADECTSDAVSALSALASQAAFQPSPAHASDEPGMGAAIDGGGRPPSAGVDLDDGSLDPDADTQQESWHPSDAQALAQMVAAQQMAANTDRADGADDVQNVSQSLVAMDGVEGEAEAKIEPSASEHGLLFDGAGDVVSAIEAVTRAVEENAMPAEPAPVAPPKIKKTRATRSINPFAGRWLNENYVAWTETESSLQRASMYASYASVCGAHQVKPVSTASFGKAVRATFPGLKTRRLGTRKNSRYCYTGLKAFSEAELERLQQYDAIIAEGGEVPAVWQTGRKPAKKPWEEEDDDADQDDLDDGWDGQEDGDQDGDDNDEEDDELDDEADLLDARPERPKTARAKPRPRAKGRPKTVHIIEQEIDGEWIPHVADGNGGLVPCDAKGEPLPLSGQNASQEGSSSTAIGLLSGNAHASSSSGALVDSAQSPASSASGQPRPKRTRAGRAVTATMVDDSDDEPSTLTPAGKKRKRAEDREWTQTPKSAAKQAKPGPKPKPRSGALAHLSEQERKYVVDVAAGLDRLRDAVPVLRVLYQTSTPVTAALDRPDPVTGLIDGLAPLTDATEGKVAIIRAAREYIVHLDQERQKTERQRRGLEEMILKVEAGEDALRSWRETFDEEEKTIAQHELARLAALPTQPNAAAGPSGLNSDGNPILDPAPAAASGEGSLPVPSVETNGEDMAALALAALAPTLARSDSARPDESMSGTDRDTPKKNSRSEDAREKNRVKQRLYRERQKVKLQELESQIHRMETAPSGGGPPSTAVPTPQQEQIRALRKEQNQLIGEEQREQRLDDQSRQDDDAATHERNRQLVQDHIERATHADAHATPTSAGDATALGAEPLEQEQEQQ